MEIADHIDTGDDSVVAGENTIRLKQEVDEIEEPVKKLVKFNVEMNENVIFDKPLITVPITVKVDVDQQPGPSKSSETTNNIPQSSKHTAKKIPSELQSPVTPSVQPSFVKTDTVRDNKQSLILTDAVIQSEPHAEEVVEKHTIKETKVFVHSVILAAKSNFFRCLLSTSGMRETKEKEVKIEVQKGETEKMMILLHCFYNKNVISTHSLQTVFCVCSLAMKYCFDSLIDKCLDIFRARAETLIEVDDVNQIAFMVSKIQCELLQHKDKCLKVMEMCCPFLIKSFYPLDECLEKSPVKFFQLHLNSMYLFLDENIQSEFNSQHGNLFVYSIQRWLKAHSALFGDGKFRAEVIVFIEKLLAAVNINDMTGDFLTNVMTCDHSPFNIWPGYKDWYIEALQNFVYKLQATGIVATPYPIIKRQRICKFVRQERNADIFSLAYPTILNGFEIGIYLRAREDRKVHIICKCKNMVVNKTGFDKCSLTFNLKGNIKLNLDSNLWLERFPSTRPGWSHDWLTFSYKQNTMCLQMYAVCKLSSAVYNLAKKYGFIIAFQMQQIR